MGCRCDVDGECCRLGDGVCRVLLQPPLLSGVASRVHQRANRCRSGFDGSDKRRIPGFSCRSQDQPDRLQAVVDGILTSTGVPVRVYQLLGEAGRVGDPTYGSLVFGDRISFVCIWWGKNHPARVCPGRSIPCCSRLALRCALMLETCSLMTPQHSKETTSCRSGSPNSQSP